MNDLPEPLTPADCDLRGIPFLPVEILRLFGSRFHAIANDAEWRAGVTLWLKSFHQVPAASVPDDDVELCRLAELGRDLQAWKDVREKALYGWIKCADGRLYHPVVVEKAREAWGRKLAQQERSKKGNETRWNKHTKLPAASPKESLKDSPKESPKESLKDPNTDTDVDTEEKKKDIRAPRFDAQAHLVSLGVDPEIAADWLKTRKAKKLSPTRTALAAVAEEARKAGLSVAEAVKQACENGWGGFKASWLTKPPSSRANGRAADDPFAP